MRVKPIETTKQEFSLFDNYVMLSQEVPHIPVTQSYIWHVIHKGCSNRHSICRWWPCRTQGTRNIVIGMRGILQPQVAEKVLQN